MPAAHATGTLGVLASSELDRDALGAQGVTGWSVQSAAVTFTSGMTFAYAAAAAGDYTVNGTVGVGFVAGSVVLTAQDPTNPRVDLIVATAAGVVSALPGTPKALTTTSGPVPPPPGATQVEMARIFVPASGTALTAAGITDRHVSLGGALDSLRTLEMAGRRRIAWFSGAVSDSVDSVSGIMGTAAVGLGTMFVGLAATSKLTATNASGEPVTQIAMSNNSGILGSTAAVVAPNKNPRGMFRFSVPASNASTTWFQVGFCDSSSATANGCYLRCNTTDANLVFITRQGGSETSQTVSVRPSATVPITYIIETVDAGVTWVLKNGATGALIFSSTTNVPTAATALQYGFTFKNASAAGTFNVADMQVDCSFTP